MLINRKIISACLVVYNEGKIIDRCLSSIKGLVDEVIIAHDGPCSDNTLEIAKKYTDKIFILDHIGEAEPHRAFTFSKASGDWILQIDADEYLNKSDHDFIRNMVENSGSNTDAYVFNWEMWNGQKSIYFKGLQKMCLFKKKNFFYCGVPHETGSVVGDINKVDIFLHHQPLYNNISWKQFLRKAKKWTPVHAKYFFPHLVDYQCFNTDSKKWVAYANKITKHPLIYLLSYPLKTFLAQLKNGLWKSSIGRRIALQQYVYYLVLFWRIWQMNKKLKLP